MALVAHQPQGSYVTFSRNLSWRKSLKLKQCLTQHHMVRKTNRNYLLKQNTCLSIGSLCICESKIKPLRISAFKGSVRNDEPGSRPNGLKVPKSSVKLEESGEAISESPKAHDAPLSYASEENEILAILPAIHELFKKWLSILGTQPPSQVQEEILGEPPTGFLPGNVQVTESKGRGEVLKLAMSPFLALDATIKIPLVIFVPFYLAVNLIYGAEVSRELTPLWVLGPLILSLYIKMLQGLWTLYIFNFKQTINVLKNSPTFFIMVYNYVAHGKLEEDIYASFFQVVFCIKNLDYKELTRRKLKEIEQWIVEKCLDFVESIWPYYCRTIRFLKRADLI